VEKQQKIVEKILSEKVFPQKSVGFIKDL